MTHTHYDSWLVVLSILVSVFCCFTALSLAGRVRQARGKARAAWLVASAVAMGGGIWSMHFIAMLAFDAGMPVQYEVGLTLASLALAIIFTGIGLSIVAFKGSTATPLLIGGIAMGLGVTTMHYAGMAAMRMAATINYDDMLLVASVVIAIIAGTAALWLSFNLRSLRAKLVSAVVMAAAVCGMHYTGMAAASYTLLGHMVHDSPALSPALLAIGIGVATFVVCALALVSAIFDERLSARAGEEAARLRASEQRFRSLVQNAADFIAIVDRNGVIQYEASSAQRILGFPAQPMAGRSLAMFVHPNDGSAYQEFIVTVLGQPGKSITRALRLKTASETWGNFELVGTNLYSDPDVDGIVFNIRDISARLKNAALQEKIAERTAELRAANEKLLEEIEERTSAQAALKEAHDELEQKVVQRTRELQLAKDEAEQASRAKSFFLASMSHEFRTPLNAVIGYSEMLIEEAEDEGGEERLADLRRIRTAGKHLLTLVNDVLDLSKIEAGRMELFVDTFEVDAFIDEAVETCRPLAERNHNTLTVRRAASLGRMTGDATRLRQCLFNLLSNACKFTENGSVTLEVDQVDRDGRAWLRLKVQDTGIGIDPETMQRLFKNFVQADAATSNKYGGTGLGLALSQRLANLMGGEITGDSTLGQGSTFTILVPVEPLGSPVGSHLPASPCTAEGTAHGSGTRVLVIDDDEAMWDLLRRTLTKEGYRPSFAGSAEAGLKVALEELPDVVILDVVLPDADGWEALRQIRANPMLQACPVVMLTIVDDRRTAQALGADAYLLKPVNRDQLVEALGQLRTRRGQSSADLDADVDRRLAVNA
jgi:PAS domain S-box-containing protein